MEIKCTLSDLQILELLNILKSRFEKNKEYHKVEHWQPLENRLRTLPAKLWSLSEMERTGGEPGLIEYRIETDEYIFFDCSSESPSGRRSLCYDRKALNSRNKFKPQNCATDLANEIGISILTEEQYRKLQTRGQFDTKTSSWLTTPEAIRKHGGAIFGDRRYEHIFIYHNGADSYYAARGFRGCLSV